MASVAPKLPSKLNADALGRGRRAVELRDQNGQLPHEGGQGVLDVDGQDLLRTFDLDVVMTSENEWGCYPTVPGLAIYQLASRPGFEAVGVTRWVWNGRQLVRQETTLPDAAPQEKPTVSPAAVDSNGEQGHLFHDRLGQAEENAGAS